jgi:hypothetical protein
MSPKEVYRSAGAVAAAVVGLLIAWSFHVDAQERTVRESRRDARLTEGGTESGHASHGRSFTACADACAGCQRACDSCVRHCLTLVADGKKEHEQTLQTCLDCAEVCAAADRIVSRGGPLSDTICRACAEACQRCAEACERFANDEQMAACAKQCRTCQRACESMLDHAAQVGQTNAKNR